MAKCGSCKKEFDILDKEHNLCTFCLVGKIGLPWMNKMKVRHSFSGEIAYVLIDKKEYLLVSGSGGMLFLKDQALEAAERFRGERDLND